MFRFVLTDKHTFKQIVWQSKTFKRMYRFGLKSLPKNRKPKSTVKKIVPKILKKDKNSRKILYFVVKILPTADSAFGELLATRQRAFATARVFCLHRANREFAVSLCVALPYSLPCRAVFGAFPR